LPLLSTVWKTSDESFDDALYGDDDVIDLCDHPSRSRKKEGKAVWLIEGQSPIDGSDAFCGEEVDWNDPRLCGKN
jgi:hypothetical protein